MYALVLQHPHLADCDLSALFAHLNHTPPPPVSGTVWRLPLPQRPTWDDTVWASLSAQCIDVAVLPDLAFSDLGLVVSDMDSTLITIECIDEIAARAGLKAQVAAITERAMQGELDFAQSLTERVALLKGLPETALQTVYDEAVQLSPGADTLLAQCRRHGVKFMLVSGGFTFFTERLKQRLGLDEAFANELEIENGRLTGRIKGSIVDAQTKADLLVRHRDALGLRPEQVLAMGDGANDIPMLQAAGIGVAYHAKPKAKQYADVCVDFGGLDAVYHCFRP